MSCTYYKNDTLYIEDVNLFDVAKEFGTPCYIYSRKTLENNWRSFDQAFQNIPHRICYSVKANSNLALLNLLAHLGSGFDIVSVGELERVLAASGDAKKVVFSGVGKNEMEIRRAIAAGIYCFDIESTAELERIAAIATHMNTKVNIAIRVNPNINAQTHAHILTGSQENKFGIDTEEALQLCQQIPTLKSISLIGLACHIGSQITELEPFLMAIDRLIDLYARIKALGITLRHLNIGGGLGVTYHQEMPPSIDEYAHALQAKLAPYSLELILEPGRAIVANAGILLTHIEYLKHTRQKNFIIVDAGMNDFMRPALYNAWQNILPVKKRELQPLCYDIAGPVCESADFLGKERLLAVEAGDLLVVEGAGAYGFSMSSNYNSRTRVAEILVDGSTAKLIRKRETIADMLALEMQI